MSKSVRSEAPNSKNVHQFQKAISQALIGCKQQLISADIILVWGFFFPFPYYNFKFRQLRMPVTHSSKMTHLSSS